MASPNRRGPAAALVIALLVIGATALLVRRVATPNQSANLAAVAAEEKRASEAGATAPGAAEVRALGCDSAAVIDKRGTFAILGVDAGNRPVLDVICEVRGDVPRLSCELVAETYAKAVLDSELAFTAIIRKTGAVLCEQSYPAPNAIRANAKHWNAVEEAEHDEH